MRAAFRFMLVVSVAALPAASPAQAPPDAKPVVVPFELLPSRHMVVQVKVNGKGPYRLIFDTGAPITLVNNKVAKAAGLTAKKGTGGPLGFAPFGMMGQSEIDKLQVGDVVQEKGTAVVMDHPTVKAISEAFGPIEGIVGFPFFSRYKMAVDYQKKQLSLTPNGYKPTDFMEGMMVMMMGASQQTGEPRVVGAAGLWGMAVEQPKGGDEGGVVVTGVFAGGPAATGGLKAGDRLITLDGRWTDTVADTYLAASLVKPGRSAVLVVKRDGKDVKLTVTPGKGV